MNENSINQYLEIDLISDNPFKNYFVVEKLLNSNDSNDNNYNYSNNNKNNKIINTSKNKINKKQIILKVQKKSSKAMKELTVMQKIGYYSNHVVNVYGYFNLKGCDRMLKPRLLSDNDELIFMECEDMGQYQTLEMIIERRKCKGSLVMTRFIMRGILASAYYFESHQVIHQTLHPGNIYILEDSLGTDDQSVVKFSNLEHCLLIGSSTSTNCNNNNSNNNTTEINNNNNNNNNSLNDRFVLGKDSVCYSIYSDRHQSRNLFKVVSANTISFTVGIIYLELLLSTIYDHVFPKEEYINSLREIVRNGKLDIYTNHITNTKYFRFNQNHQIEITDLIKDDISLILTLLQDSSTRPTITQFIIDYLF
ncbi:hypothetical protein ACTFIV_006786 [Dictyostelium citrinum]